MFQIVPLCAAAMTAFGAGQAHAHVIVDRGLRRVPAEITEITADRVRYLDRDRAPRSALLADVLAVLPGRPDDLGEPAAADAPGRGLSARIAIELTDGQRFVGKPTFEDVKDGLAWETRLFGRLEIPLDRVRSVSLHPEVIDPAGRAAARDDEVDLLNGDRVEGLVESFGPSIVIESAGQTITIGPDRIAAVMLANPPSPPPRALARLREGSVFAIEGVRTAAEGRLEFSRAPDAGGTSEPIVVPLDDLAALWMQAGRLLPLSRLPFDSYVASPGRRWTREPRAYEAEVGSAGDVEVPGPMTVEWSIPPAQRFAGTLVMPRRSLEWGDAEVTIEARGARQDQWSVLVQARLNAAGPAAEFNVELPPGPSRLRLKLEPGADGTIQDRIVIRDALLLLDRD